MQQNPGFSASEIADIRAQAKEAGRNFVYTPGEQNTQDFANFMFIGKHEGKEVIYDAVMFTLKMAHSSRLYEIAEEEAMRQFPEYKGWELEADEDGNLRVPEEIDPDIEDFKATVIMELEEEGEIKVQEEVNIDADWDYGIGLEVMLNVDEITDSVISRFIDQFNNGTFTPDPTLYSFLHDDESEGDEDDEE